MRILITGSSGYLGRWAVRTALEKGLEVTGFDRKPSGLEHRCFRERTGDITDAESVTAAAIGCDAVFHLAAALAQFEPDEGRMHQVNVMGTANLLSAALGHGVKKLIFMSSVEVYGVEVPIPCREDVSLNPVSRYGLDKVEGEKLCAEYLDKGMDVTVFRPPTINGPGQNEPFLTRQMEAIHRGKATVLPGGGRTRLQMVDVRDVCQAMCLALDTPESRGAVMNLGSDDVPTLREVMLALHDHAGTPPRLVNLNASVARLAVRWLSALHLSPLQPQHLEIALRDHVFDNGLAKRVLSWRPRRTDIESAIDAYDWYLSRGSGRACLGVPELVVGWASNQRKGDEMEWKPQVLAEGLEFPEGPIYMGDGIVVFTQIRGARLSRYAEGRVETIADTGGGANGATLGPDAAFYVANNGGLNTSPEGIWLSDKAIPGRIQRVTAEGEVSDVAVDLPGEPPHRPNDLCFGPDGLLYFTDPHNWEDLANLKPGRVNRTDLAGTVERLAEVKRFPNGIGFGPDDRLYVAESVTQQVWVYDWTPEGIHAPAVFCVLPAGFPDGFCFAANGDLIVCGSLGDVIFVYGEDGQLKDRFDTPQHTEPTNCCIGDGHLYVTYSGSGQLVAFACDWEPLPLYPYRD